MRGEWFFLPHQIKHSIKKYNDTKQNPWYPCLITIGGLQRWPDNDSEWVDGNWVGCESVATDPYCQWRSTFVCRSLIAPSLVALMRHLVRDCRRESEWWGRGRGRGSHELWVRREGRRNWFPAWGESLLFFCFFQQIYMPGFDVFCGGLVCVEIDYIGFKFFTGAPIFWWSSS